MSLFNVKTFAVVLALFLTGELLIVVYGPHPPSRRKQMVQGLPVIKQVREWNYRQDIREVFKEVEGGSFTWTFRDTTKTWDNPDDMFEEAARGSWVAASAINRLRYAAHEWRNYSSYQLHARAGDVFAMGDYFHTAIYLGNEADSTEAAEMLKDHPSASARWTFAARTQGFDWTSKESQLLMAEVARENLRYPKMRDADYRRISESNRARLEQIRLQAENGDPDAEWVLEQLSLRPVWHPPS